MCVCDGSERRALHQKGASGTEGSGLLSGALAAWEPGGRPWACWSRPIARAAALGRFRLGLGWGRLARGEEGRLAPRGLQVLLTRNAETRRKNFSEQAIHTCPREEMENPHLM